MSSLQKILVIGAGGHARVVLELISAENKYVTHGIIDKNLNVGDSIDGYPVIGRDSDLVRLCEELDCYSGVVAIGDNLLRKKVVESILEAIPQFKFVSILHPSAIISKTTRIDEGSVVMPGVIINGHSHIGCHSIINTRAAIDHECDIGEYVNIAPGVTIAGGVSMGCLATAFVGSNIINNISIGSESVVAAGATVVNDVPPSVTVYGLPATTKRKTKHLDKEEICQS